MKQYRHSTEGQFERKGFLLVSVLFTSLIVALLGASAVMTARYTNSRGRHGHEILQAQAMAKSAIELGLVRLNSTASWRTTFTSGTVAGTYSPTGRTSMQFLFVDTDGDLSDDATDLVTLVGIGTCGDAQFGYEVQLIPQSDPLNSVGYGWVCGGDILASNDCDICVSNSIHSNTAISVLSSTASMTGNCSSVTTVLGTVYGSSSSLQPAVTLHGSNWNDYYELRGVNIPITSIPLVSSERVIDLAAISPARCPYTTETSVEGIYIIDCQGQNLVIKNSRLFCTLVLKNTGASSRTEGNVFMSPAYDQYPALMVQGSFGFAHTQGVLDESVMNLNLNPTPDMPYKGATDTIENDTYPSKIQGLVLVSGSVNFPTASSISAIEGVLISGDFDNTSVGDLYLEYRDTYLTDPPPGFRKGILMEIVPGSWKSRNVRAVATAI